MSRKIIKCAKCQNKVWLGELIQLENWSEKGELCRECILKIKIPCLHCSQFFNKIEAFSDFEKNNYEQHEKVDKVERLEKELIEAKRQRKSQQEIDRLQSEIKNLKDQEAKTSSNQTPKNNNMLGWGLGIGAIITLLVAGTIIIISKSKKKNKC